MLDRIAQFFERRLQPDGDSEDLTFPQKQLAAAALMMEVAASDHVFEEAELEAFESALSRVYNLSADDIAELHQLAKDKQRDSTSLFQFTQLINDHCSKQEKFNLVESMWSVALADGDLDKHEEHVIRRVADLIHLSHTDFLVARNAARDGDKPES